MPLTAENALNPRFRLFVLLLAQPSHGRPRIEVRDPELEHGGPRCRVRELVLVASEGVSGGLFRGRREKERQLVRGACDAHPGTPPGLDLPRDGLRDPGQAPTGRRVGCRGLTEECHEVLTLVVAIYAFKHGEDRNCGMGQIAEACRDPSDGPRAAAGAGQAPQGRRNHLLFVVAPPSPALAVLKDHAGRHPRHERMRAAADQQGLVADRRRRCFDLASGSADDLRRGYDLLGHPVSNQKRGEFMGNVNDGGLRTKQEVTQTRQLRLSLGFAGCLDKDPLKQLSFAFIHVADPERGLGAGPKGQSGK